MSKEYIEREALIAEYDRVHVGAPGGARKLMEDAPAADVVSGEEYDRLLAIARKLHTWIFLHVADEEKAYDEIGLSLADNLLLDYSGTLEFEVIRKDGADNETD